MPTLELLLLSLHPPTTLSTPTLLPTLSHVRSLLHTSSRFYSTSPSPSSHIYILGQWPSLAAHRAFLASPACTAILAPQAHLLDFVWMLHLDLPEGTGIESLPLDAPVLVVERWFFKKQQQQRPQDGDVREDEVEIERVLSEERTQQKQQQQQQQHQEASRAWARVGAWRVDDAGEEEREFVVFTGWESVAAYQEEEESMTRKRRMLMMGKEGGEYEGLLGRQYVGMEVRHMRDLEAKP